MRHPPSLCVPLSVRCRAPGRMSSSYRNACVLRSTPDRRRGEGSTCSRDQPDEQRGVSMPGGWRGQDRAHQGEQHARAVVIDQGSGSRGDQIARVRKTHQIRRLCRRDNGGPGLCLAIASAMVGQEGVRLPAKTSRRKSPLLPTSGPTMIRSWRISSARSDAYRLAGQATGHITGDRRKLGGISSAVLMTEAMHLRRYALKYGFLLDGQVGDSRCGGTSRA